MARKLSIGASNRNLAAALLACALPFLSACNTTALSSFGNSVTELDLPSSVEEYPDSEVFKVAKVQFSQGNYGLAARYYERSVEVDPNNAEAWLGLAASYDRVRRFDLADRAYREAGRLVGDRPEYYNNVGYSYLLRGDVVKARANFLKAHELDPTDLTINNNLDLLRDSLVRSRKTP
jgi:Flp pilus assembly protein TadD